MSQRESPLCSATYGGRRCTVIGCSALYTTHSSSGSQQLTILPQQRSETRRAPFLFLSFSASLFVCLPREAVTAPLFYANGPRPRDRTDLIW